MASADMEEDVKCSICLTHYTNPVTLYCGHNFCRECIKTYLDTTERNREDYSCPRCRKRFRGRPSLKKNTDLSNIAEKVKSSAGLENRKCSEHNRILELYCTEDSTCICMFCMVEGEHRGHEVERPEVASEKKKKKLRNDLQILIADRGKTERRVQNLHNRRRMARKRREDIKGKVTALFKDFRKRLDDLENQVQSELFRQAEQEDPVSDLIQNLERKMEEVSRKIGRLEELNTADPITLLQDRDSDRPPEEGTGLCWNETCEPDEFLTSIRSSFGISMMIRKGLSDIQMKNVNFPVLQPTGITLDINTAADNLQISNDRKTAMSTDVTEIQPNAANRFEASQVLSTYKFSSGQHYWMVETSTSGEWAVGMGYPSMRRRGGRLGENDKSWGIGRTGHSYQMLHKGESKLLSHTISSKMLLVYLDYQAGQLSFYELSDPAKLLHTFTTTFTEPLHAVLQLKKDFIYNSHSKIRVI